LLKHVLVLVSIAVALLRIFRKPRPREVCSRLRLSVPSLQRYFMQPHQSEVVFYCANCACCYFQINSEFSVDIRNILNYTLLTSN